MADPVPVPEGTVAPAPQAPPAPAAAPPAVPPSQDPDSPWLKPRLESAKATGAREAQAAMLAELGITDVAAAKAALADAKAREEAGKTAEQRAAELAASLTSVQTEAQRHRAIIAEHAARMIGVLTPKQQELVKSFSGEDPGLQLSTIQKLTDSGLLVIDEEPAAPPLANTAPPPNAPSGAPGTSPTDPKTEYARIGQTNPFRAAAYGARNPSVYSPKG